MAQYVYARQTGKKQLAKSYVMQLRVDAKRVAAVLLWMANEGCTPEVGARFWDNLLSIVEKRFGVKEFEGGLDEAWEIIDDAQEEQAEDRAAKKLERKRKAVDPAVGKWRKMKAELASERAEKAQAAYEEGQIGEDELKDYMEKARVALERAGVIGFGEAEDSQASGMGAQGFKETELAKPAYDEGYED